MVLLTLLSEKGRALSSLFEKTNRKIVFRERIYS